MKTLIAALLLVLMSTTSYAQNSEWTLSEVTNAGKDPVGYIYHTYSRGTETVAGTDSKVAAGLRFVCSTKTTQEPVIAVFWNGVLMSGPRQELEITVDKTIFLRPTWVHEGSLIYSPVSNHPDLISALKHSRSVKLAWETGSTKYIVMFELRNFNLKEFNASCKTGL
jgi:hypothetical protein